MFSYYYFIMYWRKIFFSFLSFLLFIFSLFFNFLLFLKFFCFLENDSFYFFRNFFCGQIIHLLLFWGGEEGQNYFIFFFIKKIFFFPFRTIHFNFFGYFWTNYIKKIVSFSIWTLLIIYNISCLGSIYSIFLCDFIYAPLKARPSAAISLWKVGERIKRLLYLRNEGYLWKFIVKWHVSINFHTFQ